MAITRGKGLLTEYWFDLFLRIALAGLFIVLEKAEPFSRKIHEDELWLYKNPRTDSYVPTTLLWPLVFIMPAVVIFCIFLVYRDKIDTYQAVLSVTLIMHNIFLIGRPRPDFFWRCFPDGQTNPDFKCNGNPVVIRDGKKSFPSGHSSFAFASFGFIALYVAGKLHTFSLVGKGQSWKLCAFVLPICIALVIALSRTCDYHHHWQDVVAGSVIGYFLAYMCYRHYYPPLDSQICHKPYAALTLQIQLEYTRNRNEQIKWI
ncbi:PREDICTED: phospholipid phosphatase 5 [Habropoda laboriosa]|nr:PREDICTED: phospholipid phosphatase 5 [Habropoda laboriosa]